MLKPAVENHLWCLQIPAILTPFLGVMPQGLAQTMFPPPCLFSPAQSWKSPLPQPTPPGPAFAHLPWVILSTQHVPRISCRWDCKLMYACSVCACEWRADLSFRRENGWTRPARICSDMDFTRCEILTSAYSLLSSSICFIHWLVLGTARRSEAFPELHVFMCIHLFFL